jgi:hypothetical protein
MGALRAGGGGVRLAGKKPVVKLWLTGTEESSSINNTTGDKTLDV